MPPSPLRMARLTADMTLYDLGRKAAIVESRLSLLERNLITQTWEEKERLAYALGKPVGKLWPKDGRARK